MLKVSRGNTTLKSSFRNKIACIKSILKFHSWLSQISTMVTVAGNKRHGKRAQARHGRTDRILMQLGSRGRERRWSFSKPNEEMDKIRVVRAKEVILAEKQFTWRGNAVSAVTYETKSKRELKTKMKYFPLLFQTIPNQCSIIS